MNYLECILYASGINPNDYGVDKLEYNKIPLYQLLSAKFIIEMDFLCEKPTPEMTETNNLICQLIQEAQDEKVSR